jgi:hypothetical protein
MRTEARLRAGVVVLLIQQPTATDMRSYAAELSSDLLDPHGQVLDEMIGFVFDSLNAHHVDLRVVSVDHMPISSPLPQ